MEKIHIKKISEINREKLIRFYQESFKYEKSIIDNYDWRYRTHFNEFEPLALMVDNEICGHAGLVPIKIRIHNKQENAIWFTDFFINQEQRSKGYGKLLTEEWMKICPIQMTFCNDKSLKVFKKLNWSHNNKIIKKIEFNNYLKIIPIFRKLEHTENEINEIDNLKIIDLNENTLKQIIDLDEKQSSSKSISIVRDENWFKWRLIDCPYKNRIHIFKYKDFFFIAHIKLKKNFRILNIIYSSSNVTKEIKNIFLQFSRKNNIDYLAYLSSEKNFLHKFLPWQKKLNFAFYSNDLSILSIIKEKFKDAQLIDSDIDYV